MAVKTEDKTSKAQELLEAMRSQMQEALDAQAERFNAQIAEYDKRFEAMRAEMNKRSGMMERGERVKSVARQILQSPQWKDRRDSKRCAEVKIDGGFGPLLRHRATRALTSSVVPFSQPTDDLDVAYLERFRSEYLIDYVPSIPTRQDSIRYVERTTFYDLDIVTSGTTNSGQADVVVTNAEGIAVGSTITLDPAGAGNGPETAVVSSVVLATNTITCTANLSNSHASGTKVTSDRFVATTENATSPKIDVSYTERTATVKNIRTYIKMSSAVLDDEPRLQAELDMDLPDALKRSASLNLLNGDGSNNEFTGLLNASGIQTVTWSGQAAGTTKRDVIRIGRKTLKVSEREPELCILNPEECADLELEKGNDGHYVMHGLSEGPDGRLRCWRIPVFETNEIAAGTGLLVNFTHACRVYDRQQDTMDMTDSDQDDFVKDMVTFRAKRRLAFAVKEPKAIVKLTFDSAP